ncbi:hypothetical protein [Terricaulis sp.]|uniref:hypothetical protein n=1 Tax=Terricaulis sp. TaxID=2768686 RepID=UPI003782DE70
MSVDDRFAERWRREQQARWQARRDRWRFASPYRLASIALASQHGEHNGFAGPSVDARFRRIWQQARTDLWPIDEEAVSHEAYLAWWRENGGESEDYNEAHHVERHMRALGTHGMFPGRSPAQVFDLLQSRYSPLLAAEGFRRWLAAHAE